MNPLIVALTSTVFWTASQYHRQDLDEGLILVFRRPESPYNSIQVSLKELKANSSYELTSDRTGKKIRAKGSDLMNDFIITIPEKQKSDLIQYHRLLEIEK